MRQRENRFWFGIFCGVVALCVLFFTGCSQVATKTYGGTSTVKLDPGKKLEMITWKDDQLWVQTRDRRDNEKPERHEFKERSVFGVIQGKVIIIEQ